MMRKLWLAAFALAACHASERQPAHGTLTGAPAEGPIRVAFGRHWISNRHGVDVDRAGEFTLPTDARLAVAYVDFNRNGQFDRYAEPSGECHKVNREWRCVFVPRRATVYRSIANTDDAHSDKTYVFWEDFGPDGTELCVHQKCTLLEPGPFLTPHPVHELSLCGVDGFEPADVNGLQIAQPPKGTARFDEVTVGPYVSRVRLEVEPNARVLVWVGQPQSRAVLWSSEDAGAVEDAEGGYVVTLPSAEVALCRHLHGCLIVAQSVTYWPSQKDALVNATETRAVLVVREAK